MIKPKTPIVGSGKGVRIQALTRMIPAEKLSRS